MPHSKSVLRGLSAALALAGGWAVLSVPAIAQDETESEDIVITGSRIRTDPLTRRQPVTELGTEDLAKTGLSAVADVLQRLPVSGGGLNTRNNNSGNIGSPPDGGGVGAGSAEVDLRFLGGRRVLVLVDGLRWVSGAAASGIPGSVDLNTIPSSAIDRIEVLQESASPIYGSDAIAGVVNIITRRDQEGFDGYAQVGEYFEQGDGRTEDYALSWGLNEGNTSIVIGANYQNQELVSSGDRELSAFPAPYATSCLAGGCSSGAVNGRIDIIDAALAPFPNVDLTVGVPGVPPLWDPASCVPASAGFSSCVVTPTSTFRDFTTADRFNFAPFNYIQTPSERLGLFGSISHEFSNNLTFRLRGSYAQRQSANQAAPLPLFIGPDGGTGTLLDDLIIDVTNPFNPFGFTLSPGTTYSFIGRRMIEAGPRHFEQDVETWNVAATLEGQWQAFGRTWYWDFNAVGSENNAEQTFTGNINVANVIQAVGPVAACVGDCVPLNLFGGQGTITPQMLDFIGYTERNSSDQKLQDYSFNITGDLFDLPAGPLALAAGVEYRRHEGTFTPDPITAAGNSADIPAQPSAGEFDVSELYGELRIPLASAQPMFYLLEASLAGRYFNYSTFGSDSTYQGGLRWRPVEELLLRGSWGQGFRAPSIGELFGSPSRFDQTIIDPCNDLLGIFGGPVAPANVFNNCTANGVPNDGSYLQRNPQLPVFTFGNPGLTPETSESFNLGIVWRPSMFEGQPWSDGVTFEINYADIQLEDAIQAKDSAAVMELCAQTGDPVACGTITRSTTGAVRAITNPLINVGGIDTRAIDLNFNWTSPDWSIGQFAITSNTSHLLEFTERVALGTVIGEISREGTERGSPAQGFPEWKSTTTLDWELGVLGASLTNRYTSSLIETANANTEMDSYSVWDLQARLTPPWLEDRVMLTLGVNNVFDEDTPGCFSCDLNNMDPSVHDVPGRFGYFRVSYRQ